MSAPGKRPGVKGDIKVTDLLIACANRKLDGESPDEELSAVVQRFAAIQRELGLPASLTAEIGADLRARLHLDVSHRARFLDAMKAAGEDNCARIVAAELRHEGAEAHYVSPKDAGLLLSDEYGNAQLLPESYQNLAALRDAPGITVFPGFFGFTKAGEVVTFPRGGSDITGAILAAGVKADVYENFTDVDSVCAVDPDLAPSIIPIPELTYREMRELSYAGFGVLHDEAIVPAVLAGIPICVKNTNRPDLPGTRIVAEREVKHGQVVGIASAGKFCTVFVSKYLMNREVGFGRRFLQIFEEEGLSFEHMPSGVDNVSIILREADFDAETEKHVVDRVRRELGVNSIYVERDLALVMLVGEGMRYTVGLATRATGALAGAGVNIEMINQGASEISMMFGVRNGDREKAVLALYHEFFCRQAGT